MNTDSKIYVAGHRGLVGSAIVRALQKKGYSNLILKTHAELDLLDQKAVRAFFEQEKPEYVFVAAAKVGGIMANSTYPADFIYENILIEANVIHTAYLHKVKKLLFLGTSCIYPRLAPQPTKEEHLLTGLLEPTNAPYAVAKIAGIVMCQSYRRQYGTNFISVMPTNIYGPHDNFDLQDSHVLPALIRKFHDAKTQNRSEVVLWGSGTPIREFLHADDLADACLFLMERYDDPDIVNIGTGIGISIRELAEMLKNISGFAGKIVWDSAKPDGTPKKLLNVEKLHALGWRHTIDFEKGLKETYAWYNTYAKP